MRMSELDYDILKRRRAAACAVPTPVPKAERQSEKSFMMDVKRAALSRDWMVYHTFDSRRSDPGFPDLVLVRPPRILFAELKTQGGRVRPEQQVWLDGLGRCGDVETFLWRPADWDSILETLR